MGNSTWWCPAHRGRVGTWTLLGKHTKRGKWWLKIRCACGAALFITKHGIGVAPEGTPAPTRGELL